MNLIFTIFIIAISLYFGGLNNVHDKLKYIDNNIIINDFTNNSEISHKYNEYNLNDLKILNSFPNDMILDIRYSSKNNFTKQVLYDADIAVLKEKTLLKLLKAHDEFKSLGYKIKIWDAYRPFYVQKILWDILPNSNYIANPYKGGSNHNRACAIDITLTDLQGNEINMPTGFDEFSEKAHRNYKYASIEQIKNAEFLKNIMIKYGFKPIYTEWWHFDDSEYSNYSIIDISLSELLENIYKNNERGWNKWKLIFQTKLAIS